MSEADNKQRALELIDELIDSVYAGIVDETMLGDIRVYLTEGRLAEIFKTKKDAKDFKRYWLKVLQKAKRDIE